MISKHSEVMRHVRELPIGLFPLILSGDKVPKLVVKASKETLLAAKLRQGFSIYLLPYGQGQIFSLAFVAAFFDDHDEPLTIGGAIIREFSGESFRRLLLSQSIEVYFFDELDREYLGYLADVTTTLTTREALRGAEFPSLDEVHQGNVIEQATSWFSSRTGEDDAEAVVVSFRATITPDLSYIEPEQHRQDYGNREPISFEIEREDPGAAQEREIIALLRRTFSEAEFYWGPRRTYDREEVADVVMATSSSLLFVQAKDSPNTERILQNTIRRKRATTNSAIAKAAKQLKGALGYMKRESPMTVVTNDSSLQIDWSRRRVFGLIIVKELFPDDYDVYTPILLDVYRATGVPSIVLSYSELHQYTRFLEGDEAFFGAFMRVFAHGRDTGMFPQLRLRPPDD